MKVKSPLAAGKAFIFLLAFVHCSNVYGSLQTKNESPLSLKTKAGEIKGSLLRPIKSHCPVVLIISGSGPTDRNGNNPMMTNNSLKLLAEELIRHNIASVRYDKRGVAESQVAGKKEEDLRFDDYVSDAVDWIKLLKADKRFTKVIVLGHSEGSLIGMIAARTANADGFISVAGAGKSADKVLRMQLQSQPQVVLDMTDPILDSLVLGKTVSEVNPMLNALFRPSVQPYLISWFKYDPQAEINKLLIPVLITQGTTDIQVGADDAQALADANKNAKLVLIEKMNHILKESEADREQNIQTYTDPKLPVMSQFILETVNFIGEIK
jgi:pimeloyl-ACP methyl ester carboxylesterase